MSITRSLVTLGICLGLVGCGQAPADTPVTETVQAAPLHMSVHANGTLKATESTKLTVPGRRWNERKIVWLLDDGTQVQHGDVVARFSAKESKQDLAQAKLDLQLNTIARIGKQATLGQDRDKLGVSIANTAWQLAIAKRYANADLAALARNKVLDAVADKEYLSTRQNVLQWRMGQSEQRGAAELAVLAAKRDTLQIEAQQQRSQLDALEVTAPHDGIFMVASDWSGRNLHVGGMVRGGRTLATLPNIASMDVLIAVPQMQARGVEVGDAVHMHPLGQPSQTVDTRIFWIAPAAQTRSRQSPVKYVMMKAKVPKSAIAEYRWMPEQRFAVDISIFASDKAISVPNLAIDAGGGQPRVFVLEGGEPVARKVTLGARGSSRSQVVKGLEAGDQVLISPQGSAA